MKLYYFKNVEGYINYKRSVNEPVLVKDIMFLAVNLGRVLTEEQARDAWLKASINHGNFGVRGGTVEGCRGQGADQALGYFRKKCGSIEQIIVKETV